LDVRILEHAFRPRGLHGMYFFPLSML